MEGERPDTATLAAKGGKNWVSKWNEASPIHHLGNDSAMEGERPDTATLAAKGGNNWASKWNEASPIATPTDAKAETQQPAPEVVCLNFWAIQHAQF